MRWLVIPAALTCGLLAACTPLSEQYPGPWTDSNSEVRKALDESKVWCDRYRAKESKDGGAWLVYCTNDRGENWKPFRVTGNPIWRASPQSEDFPGLPPPGR